MAPKQPPSTSSVPPASISAQAAAVAAQQKSHSRGIAELELPKTTLTKLAKGSIPENVKMQQDTVLALQRGSTLFISYLTAAAHDQAVDRSGKTITASDVIKAITDLDFGPADALVPLLEHELAAYRNNIQKSKLAKKPAGGKKGPRKSTGTVHGDGDGDVEMVQDDDEAEDPEEGDEDEGDVTREVDESRVVEGEDSEGGDGDEADDDA